MYNLCFSLLFIIVGKWKKIGAYKINFKKGPKCQHFFKLSERRKWCYNYDWRQYALDNKFEHCHLIFGQTLGKNSNAGPIYKIMESSARKEKQVDSYKIANFIQFSIYIICILLVCSSCLPLQLLYLQRCL